MKIALIGSPESGKDDLFCSFRGKNKQNKNELIELQLLKMKELIRLSKAFNPKNDLYSDKFYFS